MPAKKIRAPPKKILSVTMRTPPPNPSTFGE
jgi:hypothetical protein